MTEFKQITTFQTRSESDHILYFTLFEDAFKASQLDPSIYKISLCGPNPQRWVKKRDYELWSDISEKKMCRISKNYLNSQMGLQKTYIYWVHQTILPYNYERQWKHRMHLVTNDEWTGDQYYADCIKEVLTEEQFKKRFEI